MRKGYVVMKFGGVPMATPQHIEKAVEIVQAEPDCKAVVVSAPGRTEKYGKVTDLLIGGFEGPVADNAWLAELASRFREITDYFGLPSLAPEIDRITERFWDGRAGTCAELVSRGEFLMATVMARILGASLAPAESLVTLDGFGRISPATYGKLAAYFASQPSLCVVPGFYAGGPDGEIALLGRGGSDVTASLAAAALGARLYVNVKDVPGVARADPRIVPETGYFARLSYRQMYELASRGAAVLHPNAVEPAEHYAVPIRICSLFEPDDPGTLIVPHGNDGMPIGLAGQKDCLAFHVYKAGMDAEYGLAERVLGVFRRHCIPFSHMATGEQDLTVVVPRGHLRVAPEALATEITETAWAEVSILPLAVVSIVAEGRVGDPRFLSQVFRVLEALSVPISLLSDVGSRSLSLGVPPARYEEAVHWLYHDLP